MYSPALVETGSWSIIGIAQMERRVHQRYEACSRLQQRGIISTLVMQDAFIIRSSMGITCFIRFFMIRKLEILQMADLVWVCHMVVSD